MGSTKRWIDTLEDISIYEVRYDDPHEYIYKIPSYYQIIDYAQVPDLNVNRIKLSALDWTEMSGIIYDELNATVDIYDMYTSTCWEHGEPPTGNEWSDFVKIRTYASIPDNSVRDRLINTIGAELVTYLAIITYPSEILLETYFASSNIVFLRLVG